MKILSGRAKDIEDVETLLVVRYADLDAKVVRETLRLAEELLDQSDLLPAFEELLARVPKPKKVGTHLRSPRRKRQR